MQKQKSHKKINKTVNAMSRKEEDSKVPVQTIMKGIEELRQQLVSIKSRKYLHLNQKQEKDQPQPSRQPKQPMLLEEQLVHTSKPNRVIDQSKENAHHCECKCRGSAGKQKHVASERKKPLNIELFRVTAPKSRQTKLKLSIQLNKIKSIMQKLHLGSQQTELIHLLASEFNSTIMYINSIMAEYEHEISGRKEQFHSMKQELAELSKRTMKLAEKHSNQKHLGEVQVEENAELRRHLSYYMSLMKDNKDEAEKCSKQYADLEAYVKELQNSNELLRREFKLCQQKYNQIAAKLADNEGHAQSVSKQLALLEADLHSAKLDSQKSRERRREVDKINQQFSQDLKQAQQKLSSAERKICKVQQEKKGLQKNIQSLKNQLKNMVVAITEKKIKIEKLEKQNMILQVTLNQKQKAQAEKDEEIHQLRQKLESQTRQNRKNLSNLEFCQLEINSLSEQIDELRKANQRYKNQHFRNKLIQSQHESDKPQVTDRSKNVNIRDRIYQEECSLKTQSKNRKKILGQIQELIQRHRKSTDSESEGEEN